MINLTLLWSDTLIWGDWGMERPRKVIYTDGYASRLQEQDVFLCPCDHDINFRFREPKLPRNPRQLQSLSILSGSLLS